MTRRLLMHCNAGGGYGMGHLMRSVALAQEARSRGWEVLLAGDIAERARSFALAVDAELAVVQVRSDDLDAMLRNEVRGGVDVLHVDSYWDVPDLVGAGAVVSNMQDGPYGVRRADLAIDANLDAETWFESPGSSAFRLAGIDSAVIRRQVLAQRDVPVGEHARPRILVVMGGTDPEGLTTRVAEAVAALPGTLEVTVIAGHERHEQIRHAFDGTVHSVTTAAFVEDLPALARQEDLIISAAGTSVWDFACMGVPMALICAVDNQRRGYRATIEAGLAIPLGEPPHADLAARISMLGSVADDPDRTAEQREHLTRTVDGRGAWRIVSAWEQLVAATADRRDPTASLTARRALRGDARMLFDWRNDKSTRQHSRVQEPLSWDLHCEWLERTLADPDRILLIVGDGAEELATVRWDRRADRDWEVSITVAPAHRGRRLGRAVLEAGERSLDVAPPVRMLAGIHLGNQPSLRLFQSAGYLPHQPTDANGFGMFAKWRF